MTRWIRPALFISLTLAGLPASAEEPAKKSFAELVAGATERKGLFDTWEKGDHLYLAIPSERLGRELLLVPRIRQGIGAEGLYANIMFTRLEASVIAFERRGERVFLLELPHRFTADEGSPAALAVGRAFGASVLASAKIETERDDGALIVDVYPWVVSDLLDVEREVRRAISDPDAPRGASFDASRSYLESVAAFPHNLEITSKLTFRPSEPPGLESVPDNRFLPLGLRYSVIELPEEPMEPRIADDRMGLLVNPRKNYSLHGDADFFERFADRWRLEPGERVGDLYRPKDPLVYYVDRTVPEAYREFVKEGIEAWNEAFEEAGFTGAIRAELLPEDADPADIRYHTVTWTSSFESFGAVGNEIADPRTGEFLDADVIVSAGYIESFDSEWLSLVAPRDGRTSADHLCDGYGLGLAAEGALARLALAARGVLSFDAAASGRRQVRPEALAFLGEIVKEVIMHEVGHTIGLDHNFKASSAIPVDKLNDQAWTAEHGISASVMDYLPVNVAPLGEPDGHHYMPRVGAYDRWAVAYLYTPDPARAREIARQSADPFHTFGTDVDLYAPGALDPLVSSWDLGDDPLAWSRRRTTLVRQLLPRLPELVLTDDASYARLTDAVGLLAGTYFGALGPAVRYVGGQYVHRDHVGDPDGRPPFVNVPRAKQLEALSLLAEDAFGPSAFALPSEVLRKLGARHWDHWGFESTFDGRLDFPLRSQVLEAQTSLLEGLTDPLRLARLLDAELKFGAAEVLSLPELMETLAEAIWTEVWAPPGADVPTGRRDLQRAWLERMAVLLLEPPDGLPADARSVARRTLADLGERLHRVLGREDGFDVYTAAHLEEAAARVERILEAQLTQSLP